MLVALTCGQGFTKHKLEVQVAGAYINLNYNRDGSSTTRTGAEP